MAEEAKLDNRRIMKNSVMLYVRSLFTMAIGLYTSRVVLEVLGIDDFGVYSVVGSLVVVFGFFTSSVASSISRFVSFELASGDTRRLRSTFNSGMVIVLCLAGIIILVSETVGLWAFGRLNLPAGSERAAMWVYQLSIATAILNLLQTSYISTIIAHERMGVFAYIDIINSTLKLAAIFVLKFTGSDKLVLYAFLVMAVMMIVTTGTAIYCRRSFAECRIDLRADRDIMRPMMVFSGWNLFKTGCDTARPTGINVVVNLFFGVALNAAVGVAMNVSANMFKFTANVFTAFKPQIIKAYGMRAFGNMQSLLANAYRFSLSMQMIVTVPLLLEMPYILKIWLGVYPDYAVVFCRLLLVSMLFDAMISITEYGINATGKIMRFSLLNGLLTISPVVAGCVAFSYGAPPQTVYAAQAAACAVALVCDLAILKSLVPEINICAAYSILLRIGCVGAVAAGAAWWCGSLVPHDGAVRLLTVCAVSTVLCCAGVWQFALGDSARAIVRKKLKKIF